MSPALPITACLGLDQAQRTGWAIGALREGLTPTLVRHGVAKTHAERRAVVELALSYAGGEPRQLLVMFEDHAGMPLTRLTRYDRQSARQGRAGAPERSTASILGQGAAQGRWDEVLDMLGHPSALRDDVEPRTWRARVLGRGTGSTEQLKHLACTWATQRVCKPIEDPDEAEGICICSFAMMDGVARLSQRRIKQRLYARGRRDERRQLELAPKEAGR